MSADANAIWMCETHASLIDKEEGRNYPPGLLQKWKTNAELRAALAQQSTPHPSPRFDALIFPEQKLKGLSLSSMRVELSRFTVIEANDDLPLRLFSNCVGLAANAPGQLMSVIYGGKIDFTIEYGPGYRDPTRVQLDGNRVRYWDGGLPRNSISGFFSSVVADIDSLRSMLPTKEELELEPEDRDHHRVLTGSAHPDHLIAEKIAESLRDQDTIEVRDIRLEPSGWTVNTLGQSPDAYFPIANLSGSETTGAHLDLAIAAMRLRADAPLVFVVNNLLYNYDRDHFRRFDEVCQGLPDNIQVMVMDSSSSVSKKLGWPTERLALDNSSFPYPVRLVRGE